MEKRTLKSVLFFLRVSVFVVFFFWTLDKFLNPEHAANVYSRFYYLPTLGAGVFFVIGSLQMVINIGFLLGIAKRWTYGLIFLFHFISTAASYRQYLAPLDNLLFWAAWPMLAACYGLYVLRDEDTYFTLRGMEG